MQTTAATCLHVKRLTPEADERQLAARVARGDPSVLDPLVEHYGARVIGLASRLLGWSDGADDVAQDVFVQVLRHGHRFRGQSSLWTWLATLTVNRCRSLQRRRWLQQRVMQALGRPERTETNTDAGTRSENEESAAHIRRVVAELPATAREVIVLRYFEELSIEQISEVLGAKRNAVEARLSRARKQLEPLLKQWID